MTAFRQIPFARLIPSVTIVVAVYIYFLIFAQFAFLRLVQADGLGVENLRFVMGAMGLAGLAASLGWARIFCKRDIRGVLLAGFALCGIAALLSLAAHGFVVRCGISALVGLGLGTTTVGLAASAPRLFPGAHRGAQIGLGTGLAYAFCNLPVVFEGTPVVQTLIAAAMCALGAWGVFISGFEALPAAEPSPSIAAPETDAFPFLVAVFLALVWLDSAAFYILQATPELNRFGWATARLQWMNAAIHLLAACLGGIWLDRGKMTPLLLTAFGCLAAAALLVSSPHAFAAQNTHWFYAAGVSLYSTALVFAPAAPGRNRTFAAAARRAGVLYAVAGWIGSALGIGMAQDLHRIPFWFLWCSGGLILGSLLYRKVNS